MQFAGSIDEVRAAVAEARRHGLAVGLVPTMGFLHEGHTALIQRAAAECGFVVVSVFVNPTQFGPSEDFAAYPRDLQRDLRTCEAAGASLVFAPAAEEVYPAGFCTHVEVEGLSDVLCGASRPGHFRGVATVVAKLFNIVGPDRAYFGQKDYQQALVLRRMAADLDMPVKLVVVPTVRHADGLAMSSRNTYLSPAERTAATVLFQAIEAARRELAAGGRDAAILESRLLAVVSAEPLARIDYLTVADPQTLAPLAGHLRDGVILIAMAVFIGRTRLIDNALLSVPGGLNVDVEGRPGQVAADHNHGCAGRTSRDDR